jgi:hypothetical protein
MAEITPEQWKQLEEIKQKWLDSTTQQFSLEEVTEVVGRMYKQLDKDEPVVLLAPSPRAMILWGAIIRIFVSEMADENSSLRAAVTDELGEMFRTLVIPPGFSATDAVRDKVGSALVRLGYPLTQLIERRLTKEVELEARLAFNQIVHKLQVVQDECTESARLAENAELYFEYFVPLTEQLWQLQDGASFSVKDANKLFASLAPDLDVADALCDLQHELTPITSVYKMWCYRALAGLFLLGPGSPSREFNRLDAVIEDILHGRDFTLGEGQNSSFIGVSEEKKVGKRLSEIQDILLSQVLDCIGSDKFDDLAAFMSGGAIDHQTSDSLSQDVRKLFEKIDKIQGYFCEFISDKRGEIFELAKTLPRYIGCFWRAWAGFYDAASSLGVEFDEKKLSLFTDFNARSSVWCAWDNLFIASANPVECHWRDRDIHNTAGPAVLWPDGFSLWVVNGVTVDEQIVMHGETQTLDQIRKEENEEVKRIRIERFAGTDDPFDGWNRYRRESGAKEIDDRYNEVEGTYETLYRFSDGSKLFMPTCRTGRMFALEVPFEIKTCEEAQNWLWHVEESRWGKPNIIGRS